MKWRRQTTVCEYITFGSMSNIVMMAKGKMMYGASQLAGAIDFALS